MASSKLPTRAFFNLPAPAKLNLFLHVVGRRTDGRHLLQSALTLIDLCDDVTLIDREDGAVRRNGDMIGAPELDLCVRAAEALRQETGCNRGAEISVRKRIPAGAGMGGGSSDAATTLIGLNALWRLGLNRNELARIGLSLGADVPFFIFGKSAFAEGIGEQLLPLGIPPTRYVVIWPGVHVSTAEIFASPSLTRNTKSKKIHVFSDLIQEDWPLLPGRNDLQPVAELAAPEIGQAVDALHACGLKARMTGSGSAVFAVQTSDLPVSLAALPSNWALFQTAGLAQHPLSSWVPE